MKNYGKRMAQLTTDVEKLLNYGPEDFEHVVSYSELSSFRQCPLKHHLEYKDRWSKPPRAGSALPLGTAWHSILEAFYVAMRDGQASPFTSTSEVITKSKKAGEKRLREITREYVVHNLIEDNIQLLKWMFAGYAETYTTHDVQNWLIIQTENKVFVPLDKEKRFGIKLKMDLLVYDLSEEAFRIVDHKSGKTLPTDQDLEIDDQFGLYQAGYEALGLSILDTVHSAAVTGQTQADRGEGTRSKPKTLEQRFLRTPMHRTKAELKSIRMDALAAAQAAYMPDRPLYSSPDPRSCGWKCSYKEAHLSMRSGRDMKLAMLDYGFERYEGRH